MIEFLSQFHPIVQALIATCFTWFMTALGASLVFSFRTFNRKLLDGMLGFAAGVMIAASFWSLLAPAIAMSQDLAVPEWVPALVGFVFGALFLFVLDQYLPHLHLFKPRTEAEGISTSYHRSILLVSAITLHNIPEGLAVGVAFGAAAVGMDGGTIGGALALAIGIGLQNFPEGTAVSVPLRREGWTQWKSFKYGQASGFVEPIAGVIGAAAVLTMSAILPYALAFAAGAMIYVVVEELIPESQSGGNTDIATLGTIAGFSVMMVLDVALG